MQLTVYMYVILLFFYIKKDSVPCISSAISFNGMKFSLVSYCGVCDSDIEILGFLDFETTGGNYY